MWIGLDLALTCSCVLPLSHNKSHLWDNETRNHRTRSPDPGGGAMSVSEAFRGVVDESVESIELAPGAHASAWAMVDHHGTRHSGCFRDRRGSRRVPIRPRLVGQKTDDR